MGVSSSQSLAPIFRQVEGWKWTKAQNICKYYHSGEYDFGIDTTIITHLSRCSPAEASMFIQAYNQNNNAKIINGMSWLISLVALAEHERSDVNRAGTIYSLFDFNGTDLLTKDEVTIMILCILASFGCILHRQNEVPNDTVVMRYTETIYDDLSRARGSQISNEHFCQWVSEHFIGPGYQTIDEIFEKVLKDCIKISKQVEKDKEEIFSQKVLRNRKTPISDPKPISPNAVNSRPSADSQSVPLAVESTSAKYQRIKFDNNIVAKNDEADYEDDFGDAYDEIKNAPTTATSESPQLESIVNVGSEEKTIESGNIDKEDDYDEDFEDKNDANINNFDSSDSKQDSDQPVPAPTQILVSVNEIPQSTHLDNEPLNVNEKEELASQQITINEITNSSEETKSNMSELEAKLTTPDVAKVIETADNDAGDYSYDEDFLNQ